MSRSLDKLERMMLSPNKRVRLKALKAILQHPEASPLQLTRCLCSEDNRHFEFVDEFGLSAAMRASWARLRGVDDDEVYAYLDALYQLNPDAHREAVVHILELISTPRAHATLLRIRDSAPRRSLHSIDFFLKVIAARIKGDRIA